MPAVLDDLRSKREELVGEIEALTGAEDFDPNDNTFVEARAKAEALDTKIKALVDWNASRDSANAVDAIQVRAKKTMDVAKKEASEGLSAGTIFTRSRAYEDYKNSPRGTSGRVEVDMAQIWTRAPILTTTFPDILQPQRIASLSDPGVPTPLLNAINRIPVDSNSVEWVVYPAAAKPDPEVVAEGAQKPETGIAPVLQTVTLETIAYWLEVSRQFNEDAGALRSYIDSALRRGVVDKMEAQAAAVLAADATIPVTPNTGDLLTGIRLAIATVQMNGYPVEAVGIHPSDYAQIDIDVMGGTLRGPVINGTLWGIGIIPLPSLTPGNAVVGSFSQGMAWLARNNVSIYETDSHNTNFTANLLTILCETRGKAIVHRPEALTKVAASTTPLAADAQSGPRQSPVRK